MQIIIKQIYNMDTIGDRLREFARSKFGSVSALCAEIGLSAQGLSSYLNNRSKPGYVIQEKLRAVGADVEYILTGKSAESANIDDLKKVIAEKDIYIQVINSENKFLREQVEIYKAAMEIRSAKPIEEVAKDLEIRFQDPTNPLGWLSKFKDMGEPEEPEEELV